ncbi:peptidyl-prolyl cis-trans isomerase fkbp53 [Phtheirospermum japonicum]|uniref:peptidylprolyl isomerase n=1 Tax=Phtheirospermum japonicum TaxID=374723 RepID=A0A830C1X1_9LAMI|nr:peptidyl-prolyl cis-trans isomerase fkbp53 [Phtheirospermum japonicum]
MAFWGIEVKPGKPYIYQFDDERGRLHISQATLGDGSSTKKSILQCKVGDKMPIYLCSLLPERLETCQLNLELEEDGEVTFSIIGSHSVHLSGFFYGDDEDNLGHDLKIEEIVDEEKPTSENGLSKRAKKKKTDNENSNRQIVAESRTVDPVIESEDDDGFPISVNQKKSGISKDKKKSGEANDETNGDKSQKKSEKGDAVHGNKLKRKIDAVGQDEKPAREDIIAPEKETKKKKNENQKVAEKVESAQEKGTPTSNVVEESPVAETGTDLKSSSETKKEKKRNKKKNKRQESGSTPSAEEKQTDKNGPVLEKQESKEAKSMQVRTFPNGLAIEELVMGKPDGKRATRGKKVSVRYIGKLKKNDKIFDSNIGKAPFQFRLGIGKVIKGWDVGVQVMEPKKLDQYLRTHG